MSLWDDAKKNLVEWYTVAADKTSEIAKIQSRRYDKFGISRDIERQFSELGSLVYNALQEGRDDVLDDAEVAALVERIRGLEADLRRKEEEIERIRREHADRKAEARAAAAGGAAGDEAEETPRVITDPALDEGGPDSAILVEPEEEANEDSGPQDDETRTGG
jgi:hypothetical protein